MIAKLDSAERTFKELSIRLADPEVASNASEYMKIAKSAGEIEEVARAYGDWKDKQQQHAEAKAMAKDAGGDAELAEMAAEEVKLLQQAIDELEQEMKLMLLPSDPLDARNIMLEVRAGTGGDEAGIWRATWLRCIPGMRTRMGGEWFHCRARRRRWVASRST